ncbi:transposase family protein [Kineococcus esterisolvens]|uniref:transposase family protein n=1 Tax=unclassified Kineococcus TaxID=2621656 RepID=UPI003D7EF360
MLSYPSGLPVSTCALTLLADALRRRRERIGSPWRKLSPGRQALLVLAHLRKGERYADLAAGFRVGIATVHRYVHEALAVLAAMTPTLQHAVSMAAAKAYVVLDGTLLCIDRVAMAAKGDRIYYSGKHKTHGLNVQTLADPAGRLIWASPALPGSRHDIGCAREHGLLAALAGTGVPVLADRGYQGAGRTCPEVRVPQRSRRRDPVTGTFRPLSANQRAAGRAYAALRAPGERANAQLKSWRVLRKIRSSPSRASDLVAAVQALILAG